VVIALWTIEIFLNVDLPFDVQIHVIKIGEYNNILTFSRLISQ